MKLRTIRAWLISFCLLGAPPVWAQSAPQTATPATRMAAKEWGRLCMLTAALSTEEGTRTIFASHPDLSEAFSSEEHFERFVAPWRSRIVKLPATPPEAPDVDVDVRPKDDGTTTCLLTFHHETPANAITILKTLWQDGRLMKVVFMKGFTNVQMGPKRDRYDYEDSSRSPWNPSSGRSGSRK